MGRLIGTFGCFLIGSTLCLILILSLSWLKGTSQWKDLLPALGALAFVATVFGLLFLIDRHPKSKRKSEWFLTDEGLLWITSSNKRVIISWKQIQKMKWTGFLGLFIQWTNSDQGKKLQTNLGIEETEAKELISLWQQKK
jgi:hypothetical protein